VETRRFIELISDEEERSFDDLDALAAGAPGFLEATLYEGEPKGDPVGNLSGMVLRGRHGRALCVLTFALGDEHSFTATGMLPLQAPSVGPGTIALTGGTGRFRGWTGVVTLEEVTNPKRWSADGSG
jgi:hypothetical protein